MNIQIANRLVELRRQHGYSQESLAFRLAAELQLTVDALFHPPGPEG